MSDVHEPDDWYQRQQSTIETCCRQLIDRQVVEPLSTDEGDTRDWNLCHLALEGWPLIRSDETWEHRYHWSDAGEPEGLAYKVEIFEAVAREEGFDVRTPRIPGLQYRDLTEL